MNSIFIHLKGTSGREIESFLQLTCSYRSGPTWVVEVAGDPCLYIGSARLLQQELEPDDKAGIEAFFEDEPWVSVQVDVSGRHLDDEQVHRFIRTMLSQFNGVVQDDYTTHLWTLSELDSGCRVEEHAFFDYMGWYAKYQRGG